MDSIIRSQKEICLKYGTEFEASGNHLKVGISLNVRTGIMPVNGLRHPAEKGTTGWYIWAGEESLEDGEFFVPMHVEHLKEFCPEILKFLGLPFGWRFLVAKDGYEDVWNDDLLLNI